MSDQLGPFRLDCPLGVGPRGCVYRARGEDGEPVAVKLLRFPAGADRSARERIVDDLTTGVARIRRAALPGVVRHLDSGRGRDGVWVATELRPEPTLEEALEGGPLSGPATARLTAGLAEVLDACHRHGIVLHNLRPANVFVTASGPVVADPIGIDCLSTLLLGETPPPERALWAAPEVVLGYPLDAASNRYGLAQIAYRCLTGDLPHPSSEVFDYLYSLVYRTPRLATLEPAVAAVFHAGLASEPESRPASGADFARDLRAALEVDLRERAPRPLTLLEAPVPWLGAPDGEGPEPEVELVAPEVRTPSLFAARELAEAGRATRPSAPRVVLDVARPTPSSPERVAPGQSAGIGSAPPPRPSAPPPTEPQVPRTGSLFAPRDLADAGRPPRARPRGLRLVPAQPARTELPADSPAEVRQTALVGVRPPFPQLKPSAAAPPSRQPLDRRSARDGARWRRWLTSWRRLGPRRVSQDIVRELYLEGWRREADAEGSRAPGETTSPLLPRWRFRVETSVPDSVILVAGEIAGIPGQEIEVQGKAGTLLEVELRVGGRTVAATRLRLHPLMDRVWRADLDPI